MRLFAALPFPAQVQEQIAQSSREIAPDFYRAHPSWVPQNNLHVTLHFFGEIGAQITKTLQMALEESTKLCPPLHIVTGGLSVLPSPKSPRVLYIAMDTQPARPLSGLVSRMRDIAAQVGAETDSRPWKAHLTLARLKAPWIPELSSLPPPPTFSFTIDAFELMESRLDPAGAIYSCLQRFPLSGMQRSSTL